VSTTGGGVTLVGRANSGSGTCVRVATASSGTGGVTSPSISVRSTRSTGKLGGAKLDGLRVPLTLDVLTVLISRVVLPSNEGGETNVVLGAGLTA
jgi:hypothetical protein